MNSFGSERASTINQNGYRSVVDQRHLHVGLKLAGLDSQAGSAKPVWSVVRVPSEAEEDRRHLHRELKTSKQDRTRVSNRIKSLLANHGLVAIGPNLDTAFAVADEIELVARIYYQAKSIGEPVILPEEEMSSVIQKFATYGQKG